MHGANQTWPVLTDCKAAVDVHLASSRAWLFDGEGQEAEELSPGVKIVDFILVRTKWKGWPHERKQTKFFIFHDLGTGHSIQRLLAKARSFL